MNDRMSHSQRLCFDAKVLTFASPDAIHPGVISGVVEENSLGAQESSKAPKARQVQIKSKKY